MSGTRPPYTTFVCYQSIIGELGSWAAWHYSIIQEGQVSRPQEEVPTTYIFMEK